MATIIRADGTRAETSAVSLKDLQTVVGGYIEIVSIGGGGYIVLDEEGKLKNKPLNVIATELYNNQNDVIVGDVVVCSQAEID